MRFMIIDTCEIIMNNHTCEIIDFIIGGNINKTLHFIDNKYCILRLIYFHYIHRFRKIVAKFLERYMKPVEAIDPEHVRGISKKFVKRNSLSSLACPLAQ